MLVMWSFFSGTTRKYQRKFVVTLCQGAKVECVGELVPGAGDQRFPAPIPLSPLATQVPFSFSSLCGRQQVVCHPASQLLVTPRGGASSRDLEGVQKHVESQDETRELEAAWSS